MNDKTAKWDQPQADLSDSARIDMACDDFEQAWKSGQKPEIESYLALSAVENRATLFRELLQLELSYRQRGEDASFSLEDYLKRFPDLQEDIEKIFPQFVRPKKLGDYDLLDKLGKGGMGVVYRARHRRLDKIVALKVLPESCLEEEDALARFEREMRSTARLNHPNIVQATDAREDNGIHYLVMEHVEGMNLHQIVSSRTDPMPVEAACEIIRQASCALEHAWQRKVIHRDIKPSNVMLNKKGQTKLLDFGLARVRAEEATRMLTQTGFAMGTVDYMAPEQWEDSSGVDIRADIYSLGCTLYFILTGEPPYGGEEFATARKKFMAHMTAPVPSLLKHRPECPKEIDTLLSHMLAKEVDDRIPTPSEVINAIGPYSDLGSVYRVSGGTLDTEFDLPGNTDRIPSSDSTKPPGE